MIIPAIVTLLNLYITGMAYMIRGGTHKVFTSWWAKNPTADHYPNSRVIGCALATLSVASYLVVMHFSLYIIPAYAIGSYLTVLFGWGSSFDTQTLALSFKFFLRMLVSVVLYVPIALIAHFTWQSGLMGLVAAIIFALGTATIYTIGNKSWMIGHQDADFNGNEFMTGMWEYTCVVLVFALLIFLT